jgi:hypothetical protein
MLCRWSLTRYNNSSQRPSSSRKPLSSSSRTLWVTHGSNYFLVVINSRLVGGQAWSRKASLVDLCHQVCQRGPWSLKEHSICAITATSTTNAAATSTVFAAQYLFYILPLSTTTVILRTISIGLFGYGLCGVMRPIAVWRIESVYWSTLPTVKTLQGLHWQEVKNSKPL